MHEQRKQEDEQYTVYWTVFYYFLSCNTVCVGIYNCWAKTV